MDVMPQMDEPGVASCATMQTGSCSWVVGENAMNASLRLSIVAAAALAAAPAAASAQTIADVMEQWGLLGTWAVNCGQPPGQASGAHITYVRRGGNVDVVRDFGNPARNDTSAVIDARPVSGGGLELTVDPKQVFTYVLVKGADGRIRSVSGRLASGEYTVRDGKFVSTGGPTPWQTRCR
jgi:hypothetical protein